MNFAKLFNTAQCGQIVVMMQGDDEDKPEIKLYFQPEGLGICSMAISFSDTDEGIKTQQKVFAELTEEEAVKPIQSILNEMSA